MPRVKIDYIVSFSSEDTENPASNLLAGEISKKKWTCSKGEPSCSVVLQLTKAVKISSLQIGAFHTALVEVLVGLSEKPNEAFEVLVPSSVFLSPSDSRRGEGVERVRSFTAEQLSAAASRRWDRVRVVCSQPYNKFCKYGLSFIHIYEPEDKPESGLSQTTKPATALPSYLGLGLGTASSDEEEFKPGELFAQHLKKNEEGSTDLQIRQATSQALRNQSDSSTKLQKTPITKAKEKNTNSSNSDSVPNRKRDSLMYTDDDDKPHEKIDRIVTKHNDEKQKAKKVEEEKQAKIQEKLNESRDAKRKRDENKERKDESGDSWKRKPDNAHPAKERDRDVKDTPRRERDRYTPGQDRDRNTPGHSRDKDRDTRKRTHSDDKAKKKVLQAGPITESPHTLLSEVVFVLSGYENPRRGALRDAALAMGGRYERDWGPRCTHLICAFPNTPKLKTVRSSSNGSAAVVVTGEWIEECCRRRRRLPWQWYATEKKFKVTPDDGDVDEEVSGKKDSDSEEEIVRNKRQKTEKGRRRLHSSDSDSGTLQRDKRRSYEKPNESNPSDVSTNSVEFIKDERIKGSVTIQDSDSDSTEEDTAVGASEIDDEATLPDFFDGYTFAIDEGVKEIDSGLLKRYVRAYGGVLIEESQLDQDTNVDYYLCRRRTQRERCVRPDWVWRCHEKRCLWPVDDYVLN